jgi:chorismate mutase
MSEKLGILRAAIDKLDADILQLISERLTLSDAVIAAKNGAAAFRPGREAALIRRLAAMSDDIAPAVLLGIWRQIMAASLTRQNQDLTFAVHKQALPAAVWHMGSALAAQHCDDYDAVLAALDTKFCRYGVVPAGQDDQALASAMAAYPQVKILARTPLFPIETVAPAYILADYLPDESGDDISLFAVANAQHGTPVMAVDGYISDHVPVACGAGARLLGIYAR